MSLIELRKVSKRFGQLVVLDNVDLSIEEGQSLVVIGASGTGKSVLLKHIVGLLKPDAGEIWYDGKRIDHLSERALVPIRTQFGFLFQMGALFDSMTVEENVAFPLVEHTNKSKEEIDLIVDQKLRMVGLPEVRKKMPAQLSGGQRKRVALARAIALEPEVILYDEPTTGLDPIITHVLTELIMRLRSRLSGTAVVVSHDLPSIFRMADYVAMLFEGAIVAYGTVEEIRHSPNPVLQQFLLGSEVGPIPI
jgi:phospholipid/cholesterol/gamma-HCH transport system ATP-binding protein